MLDIPQEQIEETNEKECRVNVRLNGNQKQELNRICEEKGIKSKSKILKSALDLVTKGTSDIDFGIISDYSKESRKILQFEDDKKVLSNCPHCSGKIRLDPKHYKKFKKEILVIPSYLPGYQCKNETCNKIHTNPKYQVMPKASCNHCFQLAREIKPQCLWCRKFDTLKPITIEKLEEMNIIKP